MNVHAWRHHVLWLDSAPATWRRLGRIGGMLLASLAWGLSPPSQAQNSDLLGSSHGGHYWFDYCQGQPDTTLLPPDPRSRVSPTTDKAVAFNIAWHSCMGRQPATCGELRSAASLGAQILQGNGAAGAGTQFSSGQAYSPWTISALQYNLLWLRWGLLIPPANFDQLVAERYGTPLSSVRNPYPLLGEDPNQTDGGSGQLPAAFTQTHNPDGSWSSNIAITCAACHGGQIGTADDGPGLGQLLGRNGLTDLDVLLTEWGGGDTGFYLFGLNRVRGSGDITNFQMFGLLTLYDPHTLPTFLNPDFWLESTSGSENPPSWWNLGHRAAKFYDAGMSSDSTRIELSWYMPYAATPQYQLGYDWIAANEYDANTWLLSVRSPPYPSGLPLNTALAEQGSVLFHTLDLWESSRHNPYPRPAQGNGSCASCHGAYAPRYVNNPAFLASPTLAGMAGNVTPIALIGTDPARLNANTAAQQMQFDNNFFGYDGQPGCVDEYNAVGYLAPPLYGVWAEAPYFHNGSVPNVWAVLKSSDRPTIWRRISKPSQPGVVMGFQTALSAYDPVHMGWQYDTLTCDPTGLLSPYLACTVGIDPEKSPLIQSLLSILFANGSLAWNILSELQAPTFTKQGIENRKIYNTHMFSQSNAGHQFTDVLTDTERTAIIEYLKTL